MKAKIRKILNTMLCAVVIGMLLCSETVQAASSGTVQIQLKDLDDAQSEKGGVSFQLYCVGKVLDSGEPVIDEKYGVSSYPSTAEEIEQAVTKIKAALDMSAQVSAVTDASGEATFSGLADGIYYIAAVSPNAYGIVEPVLVQIPYSAGDSGSGYRLSYMVEAEPKAAPNSSKPSKPGGHHSGKDSASSPDVTPGNGSEAGSTTGINGPKTGDNAPIAGYLLMGISALVLIIWLAGRMRKHVE